MITEKLGDGLEPGVGNATRLLLPSLHIPLATSMLIPSLNRQFQSLLATSYLKYLVNFCPHPEGSLRP